MSVEKVPDSRFVVCKAADFATGDNGKVHLIAILVSTDWTCGSRCWVDSTSFNVIEVVSSSEWEF